VKYNDENIIKRFKRFDRMKAAVTGPKEGGINAMLANKPLFTFDEMFPE
jgi:hypothetical protein